jgi:hypothetical protein
LSSEGASQILQVTPETYRKRLSRAKESLEHFMNSHCGLINQSRPCRCAKRIPYAIDAKRVDPRHLLFVAKANEYNRQMEELYDAAGIFKSHPDFKTGPHLLNNIFDLLKSNRYTILKD